jgi:6-phosphogluconate dehydrogenase
MPQADIGLIGLAVMGQNLVLNMNDHGFQVVVFNRTVSKVDDFLKGPAKGTRVTGAHTVEEFVASLKRPRKIMLMVKAGQAVDDLIDHVLPHLEKGDIIIDGGNSHFPDTERRCQELKKKGILFVGTGISGGEEGARRGPSMMPGGDPEAWPHVKPIFQAIAAKAEGRPCCEWVGEGGAGHYVKMVHNGIEYGDMQLICEAYQLMREGLGYDVEFIADTFAHWNEGTLKSYLIEITSQILRVRDEKGGYLIDQILDTAGQKGTGKWTGISALDLGIPLTLIGEAVFARCLSALKDLRVKASKVFAAPEHIYEEENGDLMREAIHEALYASKIISYAQGYQLMREAAKTYGWNLNYGGIALMWREGCIIRSRFLDNIEEAFRKNPNLEHLLLDDYFRDAIIHNQPGWRLVIATTAQLGIPAPCFSSALSYFDGLRSGRLPANLLQAQRDFFGAHTYERIDQPRGKFFHTEWTKQGALR